MGGSFIHTAFFYIKASISANGSLHIYVQVDNFGRSLDYMSAWIRVIISSSECFLHECLLSPRAPLALVRLTVRFRSSFDRFFVLIKCTLADDWRVMGTLYVLG